MSDFGKENNRESYRIKSFFSHDVIQLATSFSHYTIASPQTTADLRPTII